MGDIGMEGVGFSGGMSSETGVVGDIGMEGVGFSGGMSSETGVVGDADSDGGVHGFRLEGERKIHNGRVFELVDASFTDPDGRRFNRDVVRHPGAVAVVAVDGDEVVLVRQFRAALERRLLEIPAGLCDVDGEPSEDTARRELAEEAGLECESLQEVGVFCISPGFTDELMRVFLATGLRSVPIRREGPEEHWMTVERIALSEAVRMIEYGEICDAKTVIGLLLAVRSLGFGG